MEQREVVRILQDAGVSTKYRQMVKGPILGYCQQVGEIPGVVSLAIGFQQRVEETDRDFGKYPKDGVVHLMVLVEDKGQDPKRDVETYWRLSQTEVEVLVKHPRIPIDFHIAAADRFPDLPEIEIFGKLMPAGTAHLQTVGKRPPSLAS